MAEHLITFYPHRRNKDGTFDSICLKCFLTIAHTATEVELLAYDSEHICKFWAVSQRALDRRMAEKRKPN
jgi:hypothetical protein